MSLITYRRIQEERSGSVSRSAPSTSRQVANKFSFVSEAFKIMLRLIKVGPQNADQLAQVLDPRRGKDPDPSQTAARLRDLRLAGFVRRVKDPSTKTGWMLGPTIKGNEGICHEITDVGRDYVNKVRAQQQQP